MALQRLREWWAYRSIVAGVVSGKNLSAVKAFLEKYPAQKTALLSLTDNYLASDARWAGLLLCIALALADVPEALELLRRLQSSAPLAAKKDPASYWERFREDIDHPTLEALLVFLANHGDASDLHYCINQLGKKQAETLLQKLGEDLPAAPEQVKKIFQELLRLPDKVLSWNCLNPQQRAVLVDYLMVHGDATDLSCSLPKFNVEHLHRALQFLKSNPRIEAIPALKKLWWRYEEKIKQEFDQRFSENFDHNALIIADLLATALGTCASRDDAYHGFEDDHREVPLLNEKIRLHNDKINEYNRLVEQYTAAETARSKHRQSATAQSALDIKIKALHSQIIQLEKEITRLETEKQEQLSPGFILWRILLDNQAYPQEVRQGAAHGLFFLMCYGKLAQQTRIEIAKLLAAILTDENSRSFGERIIRLLPSANLADLVSALQDGLLWMTDLMEAFFDHCQAMSPQLDKGPESDFSSELLEHLFKPGNDAVLQTRYGLLPQIAAAMVHLMPELLPFVKKYPLRLMRLDQHQNLLGQYVRTGGRLQLWTRFTPPINIGKVIDRYLRVEDRTQPNSMGIYYQLFQHPLLALPVVYHEYLHYGGPAGRPSQGIHNETEVMLREIIFTRGLIAQASPAQDKAIPAFEAHLLDYIQVVGLESLVPKLLCDLTDAQVAAELVAEIVRLYGEKKTPAEAEELAFRRILEENVQIKLHNEIQTWDKDVKWPQLDQAATEAITRAFFLLLMRHHTIDHRLPYHRWQEVLRDPVCTSALTAWEAYCRRPGALTKFQEFYAQMGLPEHLLLELIAQRFHLDIAEDPSLVSVLFKQILEEMPDD